MKSNLHDFGNVIVLLQVRFEGRDSAVGVFAERNVRPLYKFRLQK
jgi:hypothetical protein